MWTTKALELKNICLEGFQEAMILSMLTGSKFHDNTKWKHKVLSVCAGDRLHPHKSLDIPIYTYNRPRVKFSVLYGLERLKHNTPAISINILFKIQKQNSDFSLTLKLSSIKNLLFKSRFKDKWLPAFYWEMKQRKED